MTTIKKCYTWQLWFEKLTLTTNNVFYGVFENLKRFNDSIESFGIASDHTCAPEIHRTPLYIWRTMIRMIFLKSIKQNYSTPYRSETKWSARALDFDARHFDMNRCRTFGWTQRTQIATMTPFIWIEHIWGQLFDESPAQKSIKIWENALNQKSHIRGNYDSKSWHWLWKTCFLVSSRT